MTTHAPDLHEAKTRVPATPLGINERVDALKSKAADALSSPYVRGAAALGVAAAGYAFVRRKKAPIKTSSIKTAPIARTVPARNDDLGEFMKMGGLLVSLVASAAAAMSNNSGNSSG